MTVHHDLESTRTLLDWEEAWAWHRAGAEEDGDQSSVTFCDVELGFIEQELRRRRNLRHVLGSPRWPADAQNGGRARFERVKRAIPLDVFIDRHGGLDRQMRRGSIVKGCCPLPDHRDDTPSFQIDLDKRRWKCFGCNRGGDVVDLAMHLWGYTQVGEVLKLLEQAYDIKGTRARARIQMTENSSREGSDSQNPSNHAEMVPEMVPEMLPVYSQTPKNPGTTGNKREARQRTAIRCIGGEVVMGD